MVNGEEDGFNNYKASTLRSVSIEYNRILQIQDQYFQISTECEENKKP
jgi:hypothetical protein